MPGCAVRIAGGDSASTSANSVGSYRASARTRCGCASAAISATAPPYECPTSAKGSPARANTGSRSAASSRSRTSRSAGHVGLLPAPYESGASAWYFGARHSINARHWLELLVFEWRQTTPGPAPASRMNGVVCCMREVQESAMEQIYCWIVNDKRGQSPASLSALKQGIRLWRDVVKSEPLPGPIPAKQGCRVQGLGRSSRLRT